MSTEPPVPYPGDAVATITPDGGWVLNPHQESISVNLFDEEPDEACGVTGSDLIKYVCTRSPHPGDDWHIAEVALNHVVAVWREPIGAAA